MLLPPLRIANRIAEEVEEGGLEEGVELGECFAAFGGNASAASSIPAIRFCSASGGRGISTCIVRLWLRFEMLVV